MKSPDNLNSNLVLMTTSLGWGGTENHVIDLAVGFSARGISPVIVVDGPPFDRMNVLTCLGIRIETVADKPDISKFDYCRSLDAILKRLNPCLIHLNIWKRRAAIFKVVRENNIPVTETLHTTVMPSLSLKTRIRYFFSLWEERKAYKNTLPVVINISDLSLRNFRKRYPFIKNTTRIYIGAHFPQERNDIKSCGKAVKVLWIGSLIERKRPLLAIDIWEKIAVDFPKAQLVMVGNGPQMELVKTRAAAMPSESVLLCGNVDDLAPILKKGHIMFHTADTEGTPKNILYALNFGIPVVAANVGAISEAVVDGENGFLAAAADTQLMENRLRELILNPHMRETMGIQGRERGCTLFTVDSMVDYVLEAYKNLCGIHFVPKASQLKPGFHYNLA